jgi:nucleoside-diphosphate-sugar epimerase
VSYIAKKFAKSLGLQVKTIKPKTKIFSSETDLLRLSNFKAKKYLNWEPKWKLNKSIEKILEWNDIKYKKKLLIICEKQIKEFLKT